MPFASRSQHILPALLIAAALVALLPDASVAAERNRITVRGQVMTRSGSPLLGTWVVVKGSRRMRTTVDATGRYTLSIAGGTLPEMIQKPLVLRVQARHKDWRIGLPEGDPELGLEVRVLIDSSGSMRLKARSNVPWVAAAVAEAAVLDASPPALLEVDFVGEPGVDQEAQPVEMPLLQEVTLIDLRRGSRWNSPAATAAVQPAAARGGAVPTSMQPVAGMPGAGGVTEESLPPNRPAAEQIPAPALAPVSTPAQKRPAPEQAPTPTPDGMGPAMGARRLDRPPGPGDMTALPEPRTSPPVVSTPTTPSPPIAAPESQPAPVVPPRATPRARADTVASPPARPPASQPSGDCRCRIEGTVEVRSDRPLDERTRVKVFVEGLPEVSETVELFMGSPRAFRLGAVPCGARRIRFEALGKRRFKLISMDPRIECAAGGLNHVQLVLEPAARIRFW